jgi:hypothetical protein
MAENRPALNVGIAYKAATVTSTPSFRGLLAKLGSGIVL